MQKTKLVLIITALTLVVAASVAVTFAQFANAQTTTPTPNNGYNTQAPYGYNGYNCSIFATQTHSMAQTPPLTRKAVTNMEPHKEQTLLVDKTDNTAWGHAWTLSGKQSLLYLFLTKNYPYNSLDFKKEKRIEIGF